MCIRDSNRFYSSPGFVLNNAEAPVWLIFDSTLPGATSELEFLLESQVGTPGLTKTIEAWNWNTATYDVLDTLDGSFPDDQAFTFALSPATDYLSDTFEVRSRVGWRQTGFTLNFPWLVGVDQVGWLVD